MDTHEAVTAMTRMISLVECIVDPDRSEPDVIEEVLLVRREFAAPIDIKQLVVQGTEIGDRLRSLEAANAKMVQQLADVERGKPHPVDGFYKLSDFMAALQCHRGRTFGWRVDYILASQTTPDAHPAKSQEFHIWQKKGKVPAWAYEQIDKLVYPPRRGDRKQLWKPTEYDYLAVTYNADTSLKDEVLALMCTTKFARPINVPAIKSALHRLRRKGRVSYRNGEVMGG